jgi:hypothetical protein
VPGAGFWVFDHGVALLRVGGQRGEHEERRLEQAVSAMPDAGFWVRDAGFGYRVLAADRPAAGVGSAGAQQCSGEHPA